MNYSPGAAVSPGEQHGIVGYTHGGQTDRPLDAYRMNYEQNPVRFMPTTDYRGTMDAGRTMSSTQFGCAPTRSSGCEEVDWPGEYQNTYRDESEYYRPYEWFGSLVQDKKDGTELMYMRNRYYDPQTGQFTQEDPIGLAGGLNLYGFAGGDPINFSDPFGLCKKYKDGSEDQNCRRLVRDLNYVADEVDKGLESGERNLFREAAAAYNATDREVGYVGRLDKDLNYRGANDDDDPNTNALGRTMNSRILIGDFLGRGDVMSVATHEILVHGHEKNVYVGDLLPGTARLNRMILRQLPGSVGSAPMWRLMISGGNP